MVIAVPEHGGNVVVKHVHLLAGDLAPAGIVADHRNDRLKGGTRIDLPPAMYAALMHSPRPKPWKIGSAARVESLTPTLPQAAASRPSAMKLRFERRTPLGDPVVPPENRIAAEPHS